MTQRGLFRDILCAVDFSEHSRHALAYAALLAARTQGKLTVLFVDDPLLAAVARGTLAAAVTRADLQEIVERGVAPYAVDRGALSVEISIGKPEREITKMARRVGCDLIVMGAHGLTGVSKMMLGSTTERVFRTASVPVLAIPPFSGRASAVLSHRWPAKCSIVPVDLVTGYRQVAATAADVAAELGVRVCLVHVAAPASRARLDVARNRLNRLQRTLGSRAMASRLLVGNPAEQITGIVADAGTDLVIMTRRRGRGLFGAQIGAISYQVLCNAGTPVLALPPTEGWLRRRRQQSHATLRVAS
jgi:nucleotide-binding universal stress UspA family protein